MDKLMIGWTTIASKERAVEIANVLVDKKLSACVQISGPITSVYSWNNKIEESEEYRLTIKFPKRKAEYLKKELKTLHNYDIPQWITVEPDHVSKDFLEWSLAMTTDD